MIEIVGASLAGSSAALELLALGHEVRLFDPSRLPRHKVCGEFLDAEAAAWLTALPDLRFEFIRRVSLLWPRARKDFDLPRPAFGISRYQLDHALLEKAVSAGATIVPEAREAAAKSVVAYGRKAKLPKGKRQFGYKAHMRGRQNDAVELYFHGSGYTGVNAIEDGLTNVCGIASEEDLQRHGFDPMGFLQGQRHIAARIDGCQLALDWMFTGPLEYGPAAEAPGYLCGDALNFTDPFTGSGMLCALLTGRLAARSLHDGVDPAEHRRRAGSLVGSPYGVSNFLRRALRWGVTPYAVQVLPGALLYELSRPRFEA